MTATTGNPHTCTPAGQGRTRHVLLGNDQGQLTLGRLRPWHRALARCAAAGLDRELAGASPETSTTLAARPGSRPAGPAAWRLGGSAPGEGAGAAEDRQPPARG